MRDVYFELKQSDLGTTNKFATGLERGIDKLTPIRKAGTRVGFLVEGLPNSLTETGKANDQIQSVFSPKTPISFKSLAQKSLQDLHDSGANPPFQPSHQPKMPDISIAAEGKFKPVVLQTLQKKLAPILQIIYQKSLDTGKTTWYLV